MIKNGNKGSVLKRKKLKGMDFPEIISSSKKISSNTNSESTIVVKSRRKNRYPLLSYHELPDYMKDNEYILNYYRANWPIKEAFFSMFRWHNETLNVWTHLLGFLLFVGLTVANLSHVPQMADFIKMITGQFPSSAEANVSKSFSSGPTKLVDLKQEPNLNITSASDIASTNWPFYVFLAGSMFCLLSSTTCHLFSCHSHSLNLQLLQLDYAGIVVMIITSFFPPIYYIFQCTPHWQIMYLIGISVMGTCTVITLLSPVFSSGKHRTFRAMLFVSMGLFGLIPAVHALVVNWDDPHRNVVLVYESAMALSYLIGTGFYVSRVPERWRPGWFDIAGHSHQIFHVFVVMGALAHYGAAQIFLMYRTTMKC